MEARAASRQASSAGRDAEQPPRRGAREPPVDRTKIPAAQAWSDRGWRRGASVLSRLRSATCTAGRAPCSRPASARRHTPVSHGASRAQDAATTAVGGLRGGNGPVSVHARLAFARSRQLECATTARQSATAASGFQRAQVDYDAAMSRAGAAPLHGFRLYEAAGQGFEPWGRLHAKRFSRRVVFG